VQNARPPSLTKCFPDNRSSVARARLRCQPIIDDERIYAGNSRELKPGGVDKGLWTRYLSEATAMKRTRVSISGQRANDLSLPTRAATK